MVPLVARAWDAVKARYPGVDASRLAPELVRDLIGLMVNDVLAETRRRVAAGVEGARAGFSAELAAGEAALKAFLHAHMYDAPEVRAVREEAKAMLARLFAAYADDPALLPEEWRPATGDRVAALRATGDFIAGMTDRYAVRRYEDLFGPTGLSQRV